MARFYLVRHGETLWNREAKYQGQSDVPLTDTGRDQAKKLSGRLRNKKIDVAYASDLERTIETANIILDSRDIEVVSTAEIREIHFGIWEGHTYDEIIDKWGIEFEKWQRDPFHISPPKGETFLQLCGRISNFLKKAAKKHPEDNILVVSHAGPIRAILLVLLNLDYERFWKFKISNTSLTEIVYDGSEDLNKSDAFIGRVNDTSHLEGW